MTTDRPLPASQTKHLSLLHHPLPRSTQTVSVRQISSNPSSASSSSHAGSRSSEAEQGTGTTGTTLWMSAQVLACYLASLPLPSASSLNSSHSSAPSKSFTCATVPHGAASASPNDMTCDTHQAEGDSQAERRGRPRLLELGSGVGYLALVAHTLGYDVVATDIEPVLSSVLRPNISSNLPGLDGRGDPGNTTPGDPVSTSASGSSPTIDTRLLDWTSLSPTDVSALGKIDTIITADTLYTPHLVGPLWDTLRLISEASDTPVVLLGLERRDSALIDHALEVGREMGFELRLVGKGRLRKSLEKGFGWGREEMQEVGGVEVWRGRWRPRIVAGEPVVSAGSDRDKEMGE